MQTGLPGPESRQPSLAESLRRLSDGLSKLIRDHIALARTELRQDLKAASRDLALALAGLPSVLLGYALLMVALSLLVASWVGGVAGFAIVGGLNVALGGLVAFVFGRRLATRDRPDLDRTATQLKEDRRWLRDLRRNN